MCKLCRYGLGSKGTHLSQLKLKELKSAYI
uniref:Uncharacterized protein n=1 Tax=Arundo donax TaxID=35708 RepID=A0A0A9FMM6_ARUDO